MLLVADNVTKEEQEADVGERKKERKKKKKEKKKDLQQNGIPHVSDAITAGRPLQKLIDVRNRKMMKKLRAKGVEVNSATVKRSRQDSCSEHLKDLLKKGGSDNFCDNNQNILLDQGCYSKNGQYHSATKRKHNGITNSSEDVIGSSSHTLNEDSDLDLDTRLEKISKSGSHEPTRKKKRTARDPSCDSTISSVDIIDSSFHVQNEDNDLDFGTGLKKRLSRLGFKATSRRKKRTTRDPSCDHARGESPVKSADVNDSLLPNKKKGNVSLSNGLTPLSNISQDALTDPILEVKDDAYFSALSQSIPNSVYVALDCEFVGTGEQGKRSVLGRCSILDYNGHVIYDEYVRPYEPITDYRTQWSGITPAHLEGATPIDTALSHIKSLLVDKIIIGHAVFNDFKVLGVFPSSYNVRDTMSCPHLPERAEIPGCKKLSKLALAILGRKIQVGRKGHCSVEDALATLDLFKVVRSQWEPELLRKFDSRGVDVAGAVGGLRGLPGFTSQGYHDAEQYRFTPVGGCGGEGKKDKKKRRKKKQMRKEKQEGKSEDES